tara:strand:+ start:217 stop:462 length:246 start_codon:yes stop_codon:yes gene_type:complete
MANTTGKKYGGRKKGTPNRMTKELRSILKDIIYQELNDIEKRFEELEPKTRIELLIKMMPFVLPKTNAISHNTDEPIDFGM